MASEEHNDPKAEAIFEALRALEGVDDALMERPEVKHLPAVLEEGESPGYVARNANLSVAFATDRRIVSIHKSSWSNSITRVVSYSYADIESISAGRGITQNPLTIVMSGKRRRLDADQGPRDAFGDYVSARLPKPEMEMITQQHDDPKAEAMFAVLRELEGVDEELLERPEVRHLSTVLEDGEQPECIVTNRRVSFVVATDRRVIAIGITPGSDSITDVVASPYADIRTFRADMGFAAVGLSMLTDDGVKTLGADKEGRQRFANYVRAKIGMEPQVVRPQKGPSATPWIVASVLIGLAIVAAIVIFGSEGGEGAPLQPTPRPKTPGMVYLESVGRWAYLLGVSLESGQELFRQAVVDPESVLEAASLDPAVSVRPLWMQNFDLMIREFSLLYLEEEFEGAAVARFKPATERIKAGLETMQREYKTWRASPYENTAAFAHLAETYAQVAQDAEQLNFDAIRELNRRRNNP